MDLYRLHDCFGLDSGKAHTGPPSLASNRVFLVEAIELTRLHLLQVLLSVDLAHGCQRIVSHICLVLQVQVQLLLVAEVGIASRAHSQGLQTCDSTTLGDGYVALHNVLVEKGIRLAIV